MKEMKKAFTLLELIIVVVIISALAAIALMNYNRQMEKARASEAFVNLQQLRKEALLFYQRTLQKISGLSGKPAQGASSLHALHHLHVCQERQLLRNWNAHAQKIVHTVS